MDNKQNIGKLIAIIGIDGSGKSTIVNKITNTSIIENTIAISYSDKLALLQEMYSACNKLGISRSAYFSDEFKHFLFMGSFILKTYNDIIPLLKKGTNVILDRYTICLKIFTRLYTEPTNHCLINILDCLPKPDLGIYLDIEVDESLKRIEKRGEPQRFSFHESKEELISKKKEYEQLIPLESYKVIKVNANRSMENVFSDVVAKIKNFVDLGDLIGTADGGYRQ